MSETFVHDGTEFDLEIAYRDVTGVEWQWSGERTPEGVPLMWECSHKSGSTSTISLPDLYQKHGPLIPIRAGVTGAEARAAIDIDPDFEASLRAGFVEALDAYEQRIALLAPPLMPPPPMPPIPTAAGHTLTVSPLEQPMFRAFLKSPTRGTR